MTARTAEGNVGELKEGRMEAVSGGELESGLNRRVLPFSGFIFSRVSRTTKESERDSEPFFT